MRAIDKTRSHSPHRWDVYFTYADAHYWQCLYRNESAAVSYWARFWRVMASEFGACENLLGYELVNEPWAGNQYVDPTIMIPGARSMASALLSTALATPMLALS